MTRQGYIYLEHTNLTPCELYLEHGSRGWMVSMVTVYHSVSMVTRGGMGFVKQKILMELWGSSNISQRWLKHEIRRMEMFEIRQVVILTNKVCNKETNE